MAQADALSRRPDHVLDEDHDNEDVTVLPDSVFVNFIDMQLCETLRHPTIKEYQRRGIIQDLKHWRVVDDTDGTTLFYQEHQYIPDDMDLCRSIVNCYHDAPTASVPRSS